MDQVVGFIGIGKMGLNMASRIMQESYKVLAWDNDVAALQNAQRIGAEIANSACEVAEGSKIVVTMLPSSNEVEEVVLGVQGFLDGAHDKSILIDMSTSYPPTTKKIAHILDQKNVPMLDAPVAGGVIGAQKGTLCIMVGGEHTIFEQCLPLLKTMGTQIFYMGGASSGHKMKIINNYLASLSVVATGEAYALAVKSGLNAEDVSEVLKVSSGRNYATEYKFPQYVLTRKFDDGFRLELYVKDLCLLNELANFYEVSMPIANIVNSIYDQANEMGYGLLSHTNIVRMIEEESEVIIKSLGIKDDSHF